MAKKKGPGGWRSKQIFGYALDVMCGGCQKWVREVAADSEAEAVNGGGRCRGCLLKEPVLVEVEPEPAVLVEVEEEAPPAEEVAEEEPAAAEEAPAEEKPVPPWEKPRLKR
jgi:hypothetical protein